MSVPTYCSIKIIKLGDLFKINFLFEIVFVFNDFKKIKCIVLHSIRSIFLKNIMRIYLEYR
ncbi:hypothetical protein BKH42_08680 [Helicobacter sp. 13S00482-2]|nr:hypothetical protein BKH42_08680 [Helicobacter sp. 13S00482-2]